MLVVSSRLFFLKIGINLGKETLKHLSFRALCPLPSSDRIFASGLPNCYPIGRSWLLCEFGKRMASPARLSTSHLAFRIHILPRHYPAHLRGATIAIFWGSSMAEPRWFFRNDHDWNAIVERLKLTPCPHCRAVGTLVRHGYLRGFDGDSGQRKSRPSPANLLQ